VEADPAVVDHGAFPERDDDGGKGRERGRAEQPPGVMAQAVDASHQDAREKRVLSGGPRLRTRHGRPIGGPRPRFRDCFRGDAAALSLVSAAVSQKIPKDLVPSLFLDAGAGTSVSIEGGLVCAVGGGLKAAEGVRSLDCSGSLIAAGAVNAHTHLYSGLASLGMPAPAQAPKNFLEILERVWWRLDRALDEASLRVAARLYIAEALLSGTTALVDHHESPGFVKGSLDVLAGAAQTLGCRLVTCFGASDRNGGHAAGQLGLAECRRFVSGNARPLVRGMVGLHASFTVGDDTARAAGELAKELGVPVHVHVAEDLADVEDAKKRGHAGPLERLMMLGALPTGSVLAHGVHLGEAQVAICDTAGFWLVHNPRSNAGNKVGFAKALGKSQRVALGTDGFPADMRAERAALASEAKAAGAAVDEVAINARVRGGFELLAELFGASFGQNVAEGHAADLVVWKTAADAGTPGVRPRHVVVGGQVVVNEGRLVLGDADEIRAYAEDEAPRLWERMKKLS
jgi:cytosine/adenosine deaminase-related metal-dependent hydrolase